MSELIAFNNGADWIDPSDIVKVHARCAENTGSICQPDRVHVCVERGSSFTVVEIRLDSYQAAITEACRIGKLVNLVRKAKAPATDDM